MAQPIMNVDARMSVRVDVWFACTVHVDLVYALS